MFDESYRYLDYGEFKAHSFYCMGGLCEVLIETSDKDQSLNIFKAVYNEAKRLESKFSRYRTDNIVYKINNSNGKKVSLDKETRKLLKFADSLFYASSGLFDITSGILRRAWIFDGSSNIPSREAVEKLLPYIGYQKIQVEGDRLSIPVGAEIDFGGIGKEYAVDSCASIAHEVGRGVVTLVNLGGDIAVTGPKKNGDPWKIKVEDAQEDLILYSGAVATSGDKNKFLLHEGRRLSHILNPKTGYPVEGAPRSVTVVASNCTEAGALSTIALLQGSGAEAFLSEQAEIYRVVK
ncbi:MAG: FAD:protein FMN transferase [Bdellovibrionota bacterium]